MDQPDPYFVVCDEVVKSLAQAKVEYKAWKNEVILKSNKIKPTETALRETIRNIDWDLEDLQETVFIVEKNPAKFSISEEELRSRQYFLQDVKNIVKVVKDHLYSPNDLAITGPTHINFDVGIMHKRSPDRLNGDYKSKKIKKPDFTDDLKRRIDHPGTNATGLLADQQAMLMEQDKHLDHLGSSISRLKQMSHRIGGELDDQVVLLDRFGEEMVHTESRMDNAMRRATRLLHIDSSRGQWCAIATLVSTILVILILFTVL